MVVATLVAAGLYLVYLVRGVVGLFVLVAFLAFVFRQFSDEREARLRGVAGDIADAIVGYVFGNFLISVLAGLVTYLRLLIPGIPFALPLAILFGFFDLVPLARDRHAGDAATCDSGPAPSARRGRRTTALSSARASRAARRPPRSDRGLRGRR